LTTETGAGQWGSALAFACKLIGLECKVFMVRISFDQKPFRKMMMQTWGAQCVASPSTETVTGRQILEQNPETPGSLGIAISEAIEQAVVDEKIRYSLGSVLNHVMLHQTIIGLEAKKQMALLGESPDLVVGCAGGGSMQRASSSKRLQLTESNPYVQFREMNSHWRPLLSVSKSLPVSQAKRVPHQTVL
jgi:tryptophan synthase beta chain